MLNEQRVLAVLSSCFMLGSGAIALRDREPPPIRTGVHAANEFGVERAMRQLEWIASKPHPMVTAAHRELRERLADEFRGLGLEVALDSGFVDAKNDGITVDLNYVQNVVARLPGSVGTDAVLIAAHYDSAGTGPGAGDDGAGVAAMLETARALKAGAAPFKNDVIFLVTDGEEIDLLGAKRYVQHGPWREKVAAVVNFEARGAAGPSIMFETSPQNAALIDRFSSVASDPVANSLAYEIYRLMPNDTDFSVFRKAGYKGLNFAFIGAHDHYHTALDTPQELDARSLQHHGEQMLALARDLADRDLLRIRGETATKTYFSILRSFVVSYPQWFSYVIALAALVALGLAIRAAFRRDRICGKGLRDGVLAMIVSLGATFGVSFALRCLLTGAADNDIERNWLVIGDGPLHRDAHFLIAISLFTFILLQARTRARADGLFAGALLVSALLLVIATIVVPGASYVLAWPLLFSSLSLYVFTTRRRKGRLGGRRFALIALLSLPAFLLIVPLLWFGAQALTLGGMPAIALLSVMGLGFLTPLLLAAMAVRRLAIPLATLLLAFGVLGLAIWNGRVVRERPRLSTLQYVLDAESGYAWLAGTSPDAFSPEFAGLAPEEVEGRELLPTIEKGKIWRSAVEIVPVPEAHLEIASGQIDEKQRKLELRIVPPKDVDRITLRFDKASHVAITKAGDAVSIAADLARAIEAQCGKDEKAWRTVTLRLHGCPSEGVTIGLVAPAGAPLTGAILSRYYELPAMLEQRSPRRPWLVPASWRTDQTIVYRRFLF